MIPCFLFVKCAGTCLQLVEAGTCRVNASCMSRYYCFLVLYTALALYSKKYRLYKHPYRQSGQFDRQS